MAKLFGESSREESSGAGRHGRRIVIAPPLFWLALLGVAVVAAALLWSVFGRLPVKVESTGVYTENNEVIPIFSQIGGVVAGVKVREGDTVAEGQVLMRVTDSEAAEKMDKLQQRIDEVRAVTLGSGADVPSADNQEMLNLKVQYTLLYPEAAAARDILRQKQAAYSTQTAESARLLAALNDATALYYAALGEAGGNAALNLDYQAAVKARDKAESNHAALKAPLEAAALEVEEAEKDYLVKIHEYNVAAKYIGLSPLQEEVQDPGALGACDDPQLAAAPGNLRNSWQELTEKMDEYADAETALNDALAALQRADAEVAAARQRIIDAGRRSDAQYANERVKAAELQRAQSDYDASRLWEISLQSDIDELSVKIDMAEQQGQIGMAGQQGQGEGRQLAARFDSAREAALNQLESELQDYQKQLQTEIVAERGGVLTGLPKEGAKVAAGGEVAQITMVNDNENVVRCYMPPQKGAGIQPGMKVMVYPAAANGRGNGLWRPP